MRHELGLWLRSIGAWVIALALIGTLMAAVDDDARTRAGFAWIHPGGPEPELGSKTHHPADADMEESGDEWGPHCWPHTAAARTLQ